ncbi:hypothetical protein HW132_33190 [Brasilonema sp. CT11]|nr:hypothetical protein [Brasilonema sp. CT11]
MTNPDQPNRLDRIESILASTAVQQATNTQAIANLSTKLDQLSDNVNQLTSNVDRVLARNAILDDVLLELRENAEEHRRIVEENQRTTNAALASLEAILLQLVRRGEQ